MIVEKEIMTTKASKKTLLITSKKKSIKSFYSSIILKFLIILFDDKHTTKIYLSTSNSLQIILNKFINTFSFWHRRHSS